ncbi:MAG: class I SAM-dependent methyltransferase [Reinekea sp.]|jgi:SAM-dependent methyltransferase
MSNPMYKEFAAEYDKAVRDNIFNARFERPTLLSLLPPLAGKNVLDLGCGPGVYAHELISRGAKVTAIDQSEQMVAITQEKIGQEYLCYTQDIGLGLPQEPSDQYDVVICPLAIHYLQSLTKLLQDVNRVLKPGGLFVFSTHHPHVDFRNSPSKNYFSTELITEEWDTIGKLVKVSFYRRPISGLANDIASAGMYIANISEGMFTEELKAASPEHYQLLSTTPWFMFYMCKSLKQK